MEGQPSQVSSQATVSKMKSVEITMGKNVPQFSKANTLGRQQWKRELGSKRCQQMFTGSFSTAAPSFIEKESHGTVKILTFNDPKRRNTINFEKTVAFMEAIKEADADPSVNIIAITGKGDIFCSGTDLAVARETPSIEDYASHLSTITCELFAAFIDCKKPIVALVNGPAIGMGVTMIGLCDTAYAASSATFTTPFTALGLCAEGASSYTFPRILGYAKASSLLLFNERINATKALEWGLVADVIPKETFEKETREKLRYMSELPIKALLYSKELIRGRERHHLHAANNKEREALSILLKSEDFVASVNNFFARKKK
ncbi:unnamed protein product [Allacma fusca]|uniref:Uncharacterized protein n=1 Tax=Allacma fusca TaxID=39272 RepID=A0A8J2JJ61_9HEXA|nr:unnamed protein product [Allacma fusca]